MYCHDWAVRRKLTNEHVGKSLNILCHWLVFQDDKITPILDLGCDQRTKRFVHGFDLSAVHLRKGVHDVTHAVKQRETFAGSWLGSKVDAMDVPPHV